MSIKRGMRRQAGLTMIELIVFIMVILIAVAGVLSTLSLLSERGGDTVQRKQAILRAEALLEEVALAHFTFCHPTDANAETAASTADCATPALKENFGPGAGESRPYFNINDYGTGSGLTVPACDGADPTGRIGTDPTGAPLTPAGYTSKVFVEPVAQFGPSTASIGTVASPANSSDTDVLLITVEVCYGSGSKEQVVLQRYRTRYAPNSMP
jgi:MSHA pilin protein MshD